LRDKEIGDSQFTVQKWRTKFDRPAWSKQKAAELNASNRCKKRLNMQDKVRQKMASSITKFAATLICFLIGSAYSTVCDLRKTSELGGVVDKYHTALLNKDDDALRSTLTDQVTIISFGKTEILDKQELTERFRSFGGKLRSIKKIVLSVNTKAGTASVTCLVSIEADFGSSELARHLGIYRFSLENVGGEWKISSISLE
jgi:hypothetical protein